MLNFNSIKIKLTFDIPQTFSLCHFTTSQAQLFVKVLSFLIAEIISKASCRIVNGGKHLASTDTFVVT